MSSNRDLTLNPLCITPTDPSSESIRLYAARATIDRSRLALAAISKGLSDDDDFGLVLLLSAVERSIGHAESLLEQNATPDAPADTDLPHALYLELSESDIAALARIADFPRQTLEQAAVALLRAALAQGMPV